jgi:hypothetical protein
LLLVIHQNDVYPGVFLFVRHMTLPLLATQ